MKTRVIHAALMVLTLLSFHCINAATLSGTYTLPGLVNGTTVNNLTDLSAILNSGSNTVSGNVIFEFTSSYPAAAETFPITFNAFTGSGNVVIRPASSVSSALITSGSPSSTALINLSGAKYLTLDGRAGGTGTTPLWQIQNTAVSGSYPAIQFINGASYDSLKYITVLSSGTSSTATILLSTSTVAGGNSYNLITNCNIGNNAGYPYNPILSSGTAGNLNSNNSILNNNIYNFQTYNNNSPYYAGINVGPTGNGSNWTISGNSIYSTINGLSLGSYTYHAIYFNAGASSTGNIISGNYIGGQAAQCGGAPWQVPAYGANGYADFDGIAVAAGSSTVSNNTIQNIFMMSKYGSSTFRGINIISGAATVSGNVIGSATDTASIKSGLYGTMLGIQNQSTSAVTISNNIIAGFKSDSRSYVSGTSGTTTGATIGIYAYSSSAVVGATSIINNSVYNLMRSDNYNNNLYFPVGTSAGSQVSGQNIIYQMNILTGISVQTAGSGLQTISKNTIYNLYNTLTGGTNKTYINGIVDYSGTGGSLVNGNLIYGLYAPDTYGASGYFTGLNGIYIPASSLGTHTITNNMVDLGLRPTNGSSIQNALITGIWDNTTTNNVSLKVKLYHNSVYIGGTNSNQFSNNLNSYAFRRVLDYGSTVYDSLVLANNIFVNQRTNSSGTAINYGIYLNSVTDVTSDYNEIYGAGTGFIFGDVAGTDYVALSPYNMAYPAFEGHSLSSDPLFVSPATATPNLHVQSNTPIDGHGTATATLVYDFDSLVRANYSPVDIGASVNCSASAAGVTLSVSQDTVCTGTSVTFTASSTNGGTAPSYNFYKNGVSVQTGTSNTLTLNNPANNDSVKVVLTSNAACVSPATATSNSITLNVTGNTIVPAVTIGSSINNICSGTSVTFTANATNGGTTPAYNFYVNGSSVQNGSSNTYTSSTLHNADSVWVVLTSNASCLSTTTATSTKVHMIVTNSAAPGASINASQSTICAGSPVTFTATATNGGSAPVYNFYRNGSSVQNGSSNTYLTSTLNNNDSVWVVITSNASCVSPATATSNKIHITVNAVVVPSITISTTSTTVCTNSSVTFNTTISNGGSNPAYQWRKNGVNVATGASYTTGAIANNDAITCVLTSNANCATPDSILSNTITMTVTGSVVPAVTINASPSLTVCTNSSVTFTATPLNGGGSPQYQWFSNGSSAGTNSSTFTIATPVSGQVIYCVLTSNASCASPATATSRRDTLVVYPVLNSSFSRSICQGDSFVFNGRALKQSGAFTDTLSTVAGCDSLVTLNLTVNPVVTLLRSASVCYGGSYSFNGQIYSQSGSYRDTLTAVTGCDSIVILTLTVQPLITSQVSASICSGDAYSFNGRLLNVAGIYHDTLTTGNGCDSAITLNLTVNQKQVPVITLTGNDTLSTTAFAAYQWLLNNQQVSGATSSSYVATQNGNYSVAVVDTHGCSDTSAITAVLNVSINQVATDIDVQLFPNPTGGQLNVQVSGISGNQLTIRIYDIYGKQVYTGEQIIINGQSNSNLQLQQFATGVYMVQLLSNNLNISRRVEVVR